jgi:hypothetical protein
MSIKLDEHGFQLICMKIYAALWNWVDLNPNKRVNVTLPSGEVMRTVMPAVPYIAEVIQAWKIAMKGLLAAFFVSIFITIPVALWFVDLSRRRGKTILQERHERGAMLVARHVLLNEISQHNYAKFEEEAQDRLPGLAPAKMLDMPFRARKAAGIHHPYTLAGIPYPHRTEQSHTMLIGTTGSGKTTELRSLVSQVRAREDTAVIFDLTGAYVEAFYDPRATRSSTRWTRAARPGRSSTTAPRIANSPPQRRRSFPRTAALPNPSGRSRRAPSSSRCASGSRSAARRPISRSPRT